MEKSDSLPVVKTENGYFSSRDYTLLGIQKSHLPQAHRRYFLNDDIILFTRRTLSDQETLDALEKHPFKSPRGSGWTPPLFCESCILDRIFLWALIVVVGLSVSVPFLRTLASYLLFGDPPELAVSSVTVFYLATNVQCVAFSFIMRSHWLEHRKRTHRPASHIIEPLAMFCLPESCYDKFHDQVIVSMNGIGLAWHYLWMPSHVNWCIHTVKDDESLPFMPLMAHEMSGQFDAGWLVLRLGRYPNPLPGWLVRLTPGFVKNSGCAEWMDKVYQTWYYYCRAEAAREAYLDLEEDGLLGEDCALPPVEYSSMELGRNPEGFVFFPRSAVEWEFE